MDPYTVFKFNFTFDIWLSIAASDGVTASQKFYKSSNGLLAPGTSQTYLYTKEQMLYGSIIKAMKDPKGNSVFEEFGTDVDRYVTSSEPIFDYQGNVNGYRQTLKRYPAQTPGGQATD